MSALTDELAHAKRMSTAQHVPQCAPGLEAEWKAQLAAWVRRTPRGHIPTRPTCDGCVSERDRAIWKQQAEQLDTYLNRRTDDDLEDRTPSPDDTPLVAS